VKENKIENKIKFRELKKTKNQIKKIKKIKENKKLVN